MEWTTVQHLDLRHIGRSSKPFQPHAATFHPSQALVAVAAGNYVIEFDAYTGSKISSINIGAPVVRMSYSPTSGHAVVAILEDCTIRSCDFDTEQTWVLHSPEKKMERISIDTEVHLALTPLQPVVFFGFHRRMSVTVVGTVEGGRAPTKIKTDLKKPIVNLACHPRLAVLYVGYADGLIRAYNIHTYAVLYTLQLDNTIKLIGAGAFAFHPTLEWIFVGDRRGTLLAWDVSTERPIMIGITQVGSQPIISVAWLPILRILVTLSKDGTLQVWKTRVVLNSNRPPMQANFFEPAAIEQIDIPRILSQQGGETVYPLPRIRSLEVHPKLNLAALTFANMTGGDAAKNKAAYTREGRKQLFAVLQSARGSSAIARFKDVKRACEAHAISSIIKYTKSKEFLVDDNERKKDREIINIGSDDEENTRISGPSIRSVPPGFEPKEKRVRNSGGTSSVMIGQEPPAKRKRTWSADLNRRFQHVVSTLGGPAVAKPKDIKDRMQVADITEAEIKNHLRKYRPRGVSPLTQFQDPRLMVGQNVPKMSGNMIHFGSQQAPLRIGESSNGQMAAAGYNYRTSDGWLIYSAPTENMLSMSGIPFQSGSQQMPFYAGESSNSLMTAAPHNAGGRKLISKPRIHGNGPMNNNHM